MAIAIESDHDLPNCLNTATKQAKKAKQLAQSYTGVLAKSARGPRIQGFFSRTMIVSLANGESLVIQFRPEPLDLEPFKIARQKLRDVVPDIGLLEDEELKKETIYAYWMTCIPGTTWFEGVRGQGYEAVIGINKTLGRILSQGYLQDDSEAVVKERLRPHLDLIAGSDRSEVQPFCATARHLLQDLHILEKLPLFVSHFDLNEMNIMLDDNCQISGIIDWELSYPLPFGAGLSSIHTLAGEFVDSKFHVPADFEQAERGFWQEMFNGVPKNVRDALNTNLHAVQMSLIVGTLISTFQLEDGCLGPVNPVSVAALTKFLTYRIPQLRGRGLPYNI